MFASLQTENLSKHFGGVFAVDNVTLTFEPGKITSIVGPNGSGKTTLMNIISGMLPFESGAVIVSGMTFRRVEPENVLAFGVVRTFQDIRLFEQMPVMDNILVVLTERNVFSALFEKHEGYHENRAKEILRRVMLWEKRNNLARDLSYGQRKLLEVARALATDADIFLFDEPFAGLFPDMSKMVSVVLKELRRENKTVVLIEHNMELIRDLSDHTIVMHYGELLAEGVPSDVLSRRDVMEAYLGE